ncbi:MAG: CPBP family intramembrane glutamic endopeptidase [Candidatus Gracilibacteria bacterium]|nr:CPBP family intramembrane glutamic endopeptidase [Candidatus Gracilibacteria bacterium]
MFPIFFAVYFEKKSLKKALFENFSFDSFRKHLKKSLLLGLILATIYLSSFLIFKNFIDLESVKTNLSTLIDLDAKKLIFVGAYIIIINSILEEFFWRAFLFAKFKTVSPKFIAYLIPAIAFSFHHVMFYYNWFTLPIFITVTIGLIVYSLIMNKIFDYSKDLFSCWLIHALVDIVQISIAFMIFL